MTINEFVKLMTDKPYLMDMGKGSLSKRYNISPSDVIKAKILVRESLRKCSKKKTMPKILLFDTETAPLAGWVFNRWNQNIGLDNTIHEWFMICWSAKWLYGNNIMYDCLTPEEAIAQDDSRIMKSIWALFNEADIIIAHNLKKADRAWCNTRFIINGLKPPKPYLMIDTLDVVKKQFGFSSNKLDALAGYFGIEHKIKTDFDLWKGCLFGDSECLDNMVKYNIKDTEILEEVYLKLLPWIPNHPNIANLVDSSKVMCSNCGCEDYEILFGEYYYTSVNKYQLYRCKKCGTVFRDRKAIEKEKVKTVACGR